MEIIGIAINVNRQVKETKKDLTQAAKTCHSPQSFLFALISYGKSNIN